MLIGILINIFLGNVIIDSSICESCIRSVIYLGFTIYIIGARSYPTIDAYEPYKVSNSFKLITDFVMNMFTCTTTCLLFYEEKHGVARWY